MRELILHDVDLQLFDGGGEGGGNTAGAPGGPAAAAGTGEGANAPGKAHPDAGDGKETGPKKAESAKEREARYRALVGGEFKDLYTADTQRIIDRRFKETKGLRETLEAQRPVMEHLMGRYGIQSGDPGALAAAIEAEESQRARRDQLERGRQEEGRRRAQAEAQRQERYAQARLQQWGREAAEAGESYPGFDLAAEFADPRFVSMLRGGVSMKQAYEVRHLDQIKERAARTAAEQRERAVTEDIRARGGRPAENGAGAQNGVSAKTDLERMTREDRAELARRAMRGETITFR